MVDSVDGIDKGRIRGDVTAQVPADMPRKWRAWLVASYDAGRRRGRDEVRGPIYEALGLNDALSEIDSRIPYEP